MLLHKRDFGFSNTLTNASNNPGNNRKDVFFDQADDDHYVPSYFSRFITKSTIVFNLIQTSAYSNLYNP